MLYLLFTLLLSSPSQADEIAILDDVDQHQAVSVTAAAVQQAMSDPHAQIRQVSEEEALFAAASRGVALPSTPRASRNWGHPWFIIKTGIGMPGLLGADIEIYVHDNWTVELGAAGSLGANLYRGSIRWRPDATCWGCKGKNLLSIGFGVDTAFAVGTARTELLITGSVDAHYIHRFARHFGFVLGIRAGAGIDVPLVSSPNTSPVLDLMLYTGLSF